MKSCGGDEDDEDDDDEDADEGDDSVFPRVVSHLAPKRNSMKSRASMCHPEGVQGNRSVVVAKITANASVLQQQLSPDSAIQNNSFPTRFRLFSTLR